jgi:hypothetical protein
LGGKMIIYTRYHDNPIEKEKVIAELEEIGLTNFQITTEKPKNIYATPYAFETNLAIDLTIDKLNGKAGKIESIINRAINGQ